MCGIAGSVWATSSLSINQSTLNQMIDVLEHRGPDDQGIYYSPLSSENSKLGVGLGHRRLSIIDLGSGHQPLANEDETIWIAFNGEIYNYKELRPQLESQGHRFRTSSDTETIVHLYEQYGVDCVKYLRGMFAFAIWDEKKQRLFVARDRMGQKPFVYRLDEGRFSFASELKALLQIPSAPRNLNLSAIDNYLTYQYVPHPDSILEGYSKLPPGHCALYENGQLKVSQYWSPPFEPGSSFSDSGLDQSDSWTEKQWQDELRERLTEAVRLRMRSDVPLGAFLSGGVDSTIISGIMQKLSSQPVHTFSIGFPVKQFDETSYAREAASLLKTNHHEQIVKPEALEILPRLIWHYDEPFSDSSAIPTMYLSDMTRKHVTVSLSGDGGDELFAGYDRYKAVKIGTKFDKLPGFLRSVIASKIWQKMPSSVQQKSLRRKVKRLLSALGKPPEERYLTWIAIFDESRKQSMYHPDFRKKLNQNNSIDFLNSAYKACPSRDFVSRTTCTDMLTYLPCDILTKVDIASMSSSLECRSPFLDHHVVELAARMPMKFKLQGKFGKKILVDTFRDILPASIQTRPKMGFGVPLDHWFREELKPLLHDTLLDSSSLNRGYFNPDQIKKLVQEHTSGAWDHSYRLWSLLVLEMWQKTFLDPATAPSKRPGI
jgi:asparagine synthase (glutamine-hydrolysing)